LGSVSGDGGLDGRFELVSSYRAGVVQRSETDQDGDGKADILVSYSGGRKLSQSEDRNGDGEADFTVFFRAGGGWSRTARDAAAST